jgi:hypothetical protein
VAHKNHLISCLALLFLVIFSLDASAQNDSDSYGFYFAPDLWYNDVDGIRAGVRVLGEMEGTYNDGPHRLDAGFWVGTWMPDLPVSYYISFLEPIPSISDFGNEGSIQIISSIREGYSAHRLQFNKRWQSGFYELDYKELSIYFSQEKLIDSEYRQYPQLWQNNWKSLLGASYVISEDPSIGRFYARLNVEQNVNSNSASFTLGSIEAIQKINLSSSFRLRLRGFFGYGSSDRAPEYGFMSSMDSPQYWINRGIPRSKGTIPTTWFGKGIFQIGGGANLRGYLKRDIQELNAGGDPTYQSISAFNTEFEFPNPLNNAVKDIKVIGDLTEFRSYLFFDAGIPIDRGESRDVVYSEFDNFFADFGVGLQISFNIPDYLGKDRGIFIRYDVPFWLSDPTGNESNFSFRKLIGIGAIISF